MRAQIRERQMLQGVQSASGLERLGDFYYVVGDDAPNLLRLDLGWNVVGNARLFASDAQEGERIAKLSKPDLEAMCLVEWDARRELLCFGSGSKSPARDVCYRVDVTDATQPQNVRAVSVETLYNELRANREIVGEHNLNLEAAASTQDKIFLFQRGNISTINAIMEYDLRAFLMYLDGSRPAPDYSFTCFTLPKIRTRCAGFSAAATFGKGFLFSASVEDTDNEIDDGATLGSFVGYIEGDDLRWVCPVEEDGVAVAVKIEGISILSQVPGNLEIVAVTDNDEGASEMLLIEVS